MIQRVIGVLSSTLMPRFSSTLDSYTTFISRLLLTPPLYHIPLLIVSLLTGSHRLFLSLSHIPLFIVSILRRDSTPHHFLSSAFLFLPPSSSTTNAKLRSQRSNLSRIWSSFSRDEEIAKLVSEKKACKERLYNAEVQIAQLRSRNRDELQKVVKQKNALTERLRSPEAGRKRFDEELKHYATEKVGREEVRQSLEDKVRRLTQSIWQTEGEEQVVRCEAYIEGMESKLQACQISH